MAKKNGFLKMFVAALVFGAVLVGCPTDSEEEKDTWSNVTSLDQLDGTWKGSGSQTQNIKDFVGEDGWEDEMAKMFGDMKVATTVEITLTIKAAEKKRSGSMKMTMTFSGGNIATAWEMIKEFMDFGEGATTNDNNHSISMTEVQPEETIPNDDITGMLQSLQINQNGTKVKFPFPFPAGTMDSGSPEIIITKQ
jgi:hypothetical protein